MHYMGQLNQFIAKALLPGPSPTQRHLQVLKATAAPDASAHPSKHTHALTHASASADTKLLATMEEAGQSGQGPLAVRTLLQDNIATESHTTEGQQPSKQQPGDQQPDLPPLDSSEVLADEIGELYMYTASDLRAIAPLWWDYSKQVRSFQDMHAEVDSSIVVSVQATANVHHTRTVRSGLCSAWCLHPIFGCNTIFHSSRH